MAFFYNCVILIIQQKYLLLSCFILYERRPINKKITLHFLHLCKIPDPRMCIYMYLRFNSSVQDRRIYIQSTLSNKKKSVINLRVPNMVQCILLRQIIEYINCLQTRNFPILVNERGLFVQQQFVSFPSFPWGKVGNGMYPILKMNYICSVTY